LSKRSERKKIMWPLSQRALPARYAQALDRVGRQYGTEPIMPLALRRWLRATKSSASVDIDLIIRHERQGMP
jgi:hypothetical protein